MSISSCDVVSLPQDPALPGCAWLAARAAAANGSARRYTVVRHRPGRRMVVREDGAAGYLAIYWKLYPSERGARLRERYGELHRRAGAGELAFTVPEPIGYWPEARALALRECGGHPITDRISSRIVAHCARAGAALASLHATAWNPERDWTLEDEARMLRQACAALMTARLRPGVRAEAVLARITRAWAQAPTATVPLHRNFHPGQVLGTPTGGISILDWDDAARGAAAMDVGSFVAHLRVAALRAPLHARAWGGAARAFTAAYGRSRPGDAAVDLAPYVAGALVRLAAAAWERRSDLAEVNGLIELAESSVSPAAG